MRLALSAASAPSAVMTRMLQRDLECFGTRHQHGHGGREGATQLALLYTAVQRFSGRLCAAPGLPSGRARRRPESCSAVPWMRKSHLGVCYDDSASAAERRSASKAMQLEGSPHRLLTAEGLPACPVSLAGPAASPCPQSWGSRKAVWQRSETSMPLPVERSGQ